MNSSAEGLLNINHVVVIGSGIIGLAVTHHLIQAGLRVTVVDREPSGDKASFGNAGGIAVSEVIPASVPGLVWRVPGWLLDPLGPLALRPAYAPKLIPWLVRFSRAGTRKEMRRIAQALAALNLRTYDDLLPMLEAHGLSNELHRRGALTIYETDEGFRRDQADWMLRRELGVFWEKVSGPELRELEPALGTAANHAVLTPQWSHINDPKVLMDRLRKSLSARGVAFSTGEVRHVADTSSGARILLADGTTIVSDRVVVAAGAWSGLLSKQLGDPVLLESERGYNTTIMNSGVSLEREIIFAERKFVATPLSCGLRIGGAAEFGGLDATPNYKRSKALVKLAKIYLPGLNSTEGVNWAGHRPATPDSLPVIDRSKHAPHVFYAFGHGHLGLAQAATTGRLVADIILNRTPPIDLSPYSVSRFA